MEAVIWVSVTPFVVDLQVGDEAPEEVMESEDRPENPLCQPQRPPKSHSCPAFVLEAVTQVRPLPRYV